MIPLSKVGEDGLGHCFENSATLILNGLEGFYCEGIVWNPIQKAPMHHAWCEVDHNGKDVVIDAGHGDPVAIPKGLYYLRGRVGKVYRLTKKEMCAELVRVEKYTNLKLTNEDLENYERRSERQVD